MDEFLGAIGQLMAPAVAVGSAFIFIAIIALIFYTTLLEGRAERGRRLDVDL